MDTDILEKWERKPYLLHMMDTDILLKVKRDISLHRMDTNILGKYVTYGTSVTIRYCIDVFFVHLSDDPFIVTEFEYFFTVFVYYFSVLSRDFVFVNDCDFPDLFFYYFAQTIMI